MPSLRGYSVKAWRRGKGGGTPINPEALQDLEARMKEYADAQAAGGVLLGSAPITSNASNNDTTSPGTDVPGLSVTADVGARPVIVLFSCRGINGAAAGSVNVDIVEDGTVIAGVQSAQAAVVIPASVITPPRSPSVGSHTWKVQLWGSTATSVIQASAARPAVLTVIEV